jgi:hypothetical protein
MAVQVELQKKMFKKDSNCFVLCHTKQGGLVCKYLKSKRKFMFGKILIIYKQHSVCTGKVIMLFVSSIIPGINNC